MANFISTNGTFVVSFNYAAKTAKGEVPVLLLQPTDEVKLPELDMQGKDKVSLSLWINGVSAEDAAVKFPVGSKITGSLAINDEPEADREDYDGTQNPYSRHRCYFESVSKFELSRAAIGRKELLAAADKAAAAA